jgi:hypothetical protein
MSCHGWVSYSNPATGAKARKAFAELRQLPDLIRQIIAEDEKDGLLGSSNE